jgi:hypothetical protein
MLLINIHQLDVVLAYSVCRRALEDEVDDVWAVLGLECKNIAALCSTEDFRKRVKIDAERDIAIAAVWLEDF